VRVIEVEMRIHHSRHRLVGDRLQLLDKHPRRGRRDVVVDDDRVGVVDQDRGVPDHLHRAGADGVVDAWLDLGKPERLAGDRRAGRAARLRGQGPGIPAHHHGDREQRRDRDHQCQSTHMQNSRWRRTAPRG
jgi:hypothetical protein